VLGAPGARGSMTRSRILQAVQQGLSGYRASGGSGCLQHDSALATQLGRSSVLPRLDGWLCRWHSSCCADKEVEPRHCFAVAAAPSCHIKYCERSPLQRKGMRRLRRPALRRGEQAAPGAAALLRSKQPVLPLLRLAWTPGNRRRAARARAPVRRRTARTWPAGSPARRPAPAAAARSLLQGRRCVLPLLVGHTWRRPRQAGRQGLPRHRAGCRRSERRGAHARGARCARAAPRRRAGPRGAARGAARAARARRPPRPRRRPASGPQRRRSCGAAGGAAPRCRRMRSWRPRRTSGPLRRPPLVLGCTATRRAR